MKRIAILIISIVLLSSCGNDSIQNYVGCEVVSIYEYKSFKVLRLRKKNGNRDNSSYQIIEVTCYDADGYSVGDTIKIRKIR